MSRDRDDKLNQDGDRLEFTLEEILAEYGVEERKESGEPIPIPLQPREDGGEDGPDLIPVPDRPKRKPGKLLTFPGRGAAPEAAPEEGPAPEAEEDPDGSCLEEPDGPEEPDEPEPAEPPRRPAEKVISFPGEEPEEGNPIAAGLRRLKEKADRYADHMFEEENAGESIEERRAEKYIPGVDEEEPPEERPPRRRRRQPPPAPDLPPLELFRRYGKGLGVLRLRTVLAFLLCLPLLYLTLAPGMGVALPGRLAGEAALQLFVQAGLLGAVMLLGIDVIGRGLLGLFTLRAGMESLTALSCALALADAVTLALADGGNGRQPYCAVAALALAFGLWGSAMKREGLRLACRTAASASEPYLITLDENKWNGRDAYAKWSGEPIGFGRQIQAADGAERIFHVAAPLILLACLLFSLLSSVGQQRPEDLVWCLSATLASGASLSSALCYGLPWRALSRRLARSGAALAGWDGVTGTGGSAGILLTDTDLFPPGTVTLNGIKIFGDFPVEQVVGVTATLIRDTGCGLDKIFHDLLRSQGAIYRRTTDFCCYEGGGVSATVRGERVLVGSAAFMHLMEVALPQGLNVKNAVFCAIDGELAGIFALKYTLHGTVEPALYALIHNHISPVLATRDFNIIPAMLRQRFKLPADRMEFPAVERRVELSDSRQSHSDILTAVLCREGVGPFTEATVGGKRLRLAVRISAGLTCLGSCAGVLLAFYLTFSAAYASLSPANLLVFLAMWLVPTVLISNWVDRY